jgi:ATP-dependent DNA helicase RecG
MLAILPLFWYVKRRKGGASILFNLESVNTEFKREFSDNIKKTVAAFANTNGGNIYIGVEDSGNIIGVSNPDFVMRQVTDSIRNSIKPDITRFIKISTISENGKSIIEISIERGTSIPYYLADYGLRPSGVYIRVGSSSVPASEEHIRQMIKEADGERYITARSLIQQLTFDWVQKEFDEKKIPFGDPQKRSLYIVDENGLYTNLGLLLSEQCEHTTKIAVFEGNTKAIFKSRKEFTGSLIRQLYNIIEYVDYFNHVHAEIGAVRRIETRDYPVAAIREAVLNALVHREYGLSASTFINVYDDRIEFLTVGGLAPGITLDAVLSGVSHSRNEALADIFYRLELIEAFGTGIMRIMNAYTDYPVKPEINVTDSSFMLKLPNMRLRRKESSIDANKQEDTVMELIKRDGFVTSDSLIDKLKLGKTRCYNILKGMVATGKVKKVKNGRRTEYHTP